MKRLLVLAALVIFCFGSGYGQSDNLDPSFGTNGIVKTDIGESYNYASFARKVLHKADGSIYLVFQIGDLRYTNGKYQYFIIKKHSDGSTDSSYGHNGSSISVKMEQADALLQADGKIILGGIIETGYGDFAVSLARFKSDGNPDSSFSNDGKLLIPDFSYGNFTPVSLLDYNGKLLICGGYKIARYNYDGTIDSSFNRGGFIQTDFVVAGGSTVKNNGKIVVTGSGIIARYKPDGSADSTFSTDGKQALNTYSELPASVSIQNDGKILVGVDTSSYDSNAGKTVFGVVLEKYNTDGNLDSSFSGDGKVITDFSRHSNYQYPANSLANEVALQSNGKIVVGGNKGDSVFTIVRYNNDGSVDHTFSQNGTLKSTFEVSSLTVLQNNKIVAAGSVNSNYNVARYTANGTADNTFDHDGNVTGSIRSGYTTYKNIAIQQDGKIVATGKTWNGSGFDFVLVRYNTNGTIDSTFSGDGVQKIGFTSTSAAIQSDGKIVVAGYVADSNKTLFAVARFSADGSLDNTFEGDGKLQTDFGFSLNKANSVAIQIDGKIVVVGSAKVNSFGEIGFAIARYNSNGSPDKSFSGDGKETFGIPTGDPEEGDFEKSSAYSVAVQINGKIVVGGISQSGSNQFAAVAKLNTDGSFDSTFSSDGRTFRFSDAQSCSVAVQRDGKIVLGVSSNYRGYSNDNFVRYNTDGSVDVGNGIEFPFDLSITPSDYDFGNSLAIDSSGKIVLSGFALSVYKANGSFDSTFSKDGKQITSVAEKNQFINAIAVAGNKFYAAGYSVISGYVGSVARYLLSDKNENTPPTVSITAPANNAVYTVGNYIKVNATATDADGTITKVEFYRDSSLLHTEYLIPYGYQLKNLPLGNYTITAKAYDNSGNVTTSAPVHFSVVINQAPAVSITTPANNAVYTVGNYIKVNAAATDTDGKITKVEFYSDSVLLHTETVLPYGYQLKHLPAGTYTITAKATDNLGLSATSAPVTITVLDSAPIVSSRPTGEKQKTALKDALSIRAFPNPATQILNIQTSGLQQNKPATISIISVSGIVLKKISIINSSTSLDISSLSCGVYTLKIVSGDKVSYKQFVKL